MSVPDVADAPVETVRAAMEACAAQLPISQLVPLQPELQVQAPYRSTAPKLLHVVASL